ncbi:MAG TPA: hypothetical protein VJ810_23690 [Blastocatellia bacterium]|nr:hypothetical protein [Blastocatellia bacterium]
MGEMGGNEDNKQASANAPIYETAISINGQIRVTLIPSPFKGDKYGQMALMHIMFDPIEEGGEPICFASSHPIPASSLGTNLHSGASLWVKGTLGRLKPILAFAIGNIAALMADATASHYFKMFPSQAEQRKILDRMISTIKKFAGLTDGSNKPGPRPNRITLGTIKSAMQKAASEKRSWRKVSPEDVAKVIGVSLSSFERALRSHDTTWREMKERVFGPSSK